MTIMHTTRRRLVAALGATVGAALLASTAGPVGTAAADDLSPYTGGYAGDPVLVDPGTLGDAVPGSFVTATLNVLGASHTAGGDPRRSGAARMVWSVQLLEDNGVDLVGLQELENPQMRAFKRLAGGTFELFYPGRDPRDAIAFRRSRFELVGTDSSVRIPYRRNVRTMPVVVLRDRVTGQRTIVMSVHNVAGESRKWSGRRGISINRELAAVARLHARTGLPVLLVGDFNDRRQFFFCKVSGAGLASASTWWKAPVDPAVGSPGCELPRRAGIDWIWGSEGITFAGYVKQDGGLVDQATDHPLVLARVVR